MCLYVNKEIEKYVKHLEKILFHFLQFQLSNAKYQQISPHSSDLASSFNNYFFKNFTNFLVGRVVIGAEWLKYSTVTM